MPLLRGRSAEVRPPRARTTVTGNLTFDDNDQLTTLAGFDNLTSLGGSLTIRDHDLLGQCLAEAFRDDLSTTTATPSAPPS